MQTRVRKSRILFCLLGLSTLLGLTVPGRAAPPPNRSETPNRIVASTSAFLVAAADSAPSEPVAPLPIPEKKRKASFLAAAGLIVLSLLILASGLALLHAFRRR